MTVYVDISINYFTMSLYVQFAWQLICVYIYFRTFVPSFRLVKQTMLQTSSCQIMDQKSGIVLGFGPVNYKQQKTLQMLVNHKIKLLLFLNNVLP